MWTATVYGIFTDIRPVIEAVETVEAAGKTCLIVHGEVRTPRFGEQLFSTRAEAVEAAARAIEHKAAILLETARSLRAEVAAGEVASV